MAAGAALLRRRLACQRAGLVRTRASPVAGAEPEGGGGDTRASRSTHQVPPRAYRVRRREGISGVGWLVLCVHNCYMGTEERRQRDSSR